MHFPAPGLLAGRAVRGTWARQNWLGWTLAAALVLPALLFAAIAWYDHDRVLAEAMAEAQRTTATLREHALKVLETHELLIRQVDRRVRGLDWEAIRASSLEQELREIHENHPQIAEIGLADAEGWLRISSVPVPSAGVSVSHRSYWAAQRKQDAGTYISRPFLPIGGSVPGFGLSRRRTTPNGDFDGTIQIVVSIPYFTRFWRETAPEPETTVLLFRADGELLSRIPPTGMTQFAPSGRLMQAIAAMPDGAYRSPSEVDGIDRIIANSRLGQYPLYIAYGRPVDTILDPWRMRMFGFGALFAATALALLLAILMAVRQAEGREREAARRSAAEAGALEAQKLETLGHLACSMTHDFNNALQVVIGNLKLLQKRAQMEDPTLARRIQAALQGAEMGRHLTGRLLNYARQHPSGDTSTPFDLHLCIREAEPLLRQAVGARVKLLLDLAPDAGKILGDRGECQVALLNLVINARDAMPEGGIVTIRTARLSLPDAESLTVTVADTGTGMPPEIASHAFDAFFTTKEPGRGTGLGLAQVWSFAQQAGGTARIRSELGRGTAVTMTLPCADAAARQAPRQLTDPQSFSEAPP